MAEENERQGDTPKGPEGETPQSAADASRPSGEKAADPVKTAPGGEGSDGGPAPEKAPPKPAVPKPPAKPAPPAKPKGPQKEPYSGPLVEALKTAFPDQLTDAYTFLGMRHLVVRKDRLAQVMGFLRRNEHEPFDFLSDETATHWPVEEEFELVYVLFSFVTNQRVIVKARVKEWETIESVVSVWPGADWLEREVYDMFGVRYVNHPNLKRILLPDDWVGFPLRKDYDVKLQDVEWVRKHLGIESGQRFYVDKATHDDT